MELDIKKAFNAAFSGEGWYLKWILPAINFLLLGLLNFDKMGVALPIQLNQNIGLALLIGILALIICTICDGFFIQYAHNEIQNKEILMPQIKTKFLEYFVLGLKYYVINLFYYFILMLPLSILMAGVGPLFLKSNPILAMIIIFGSSILFIIVQLMMLFACGILAETLNLGGTLNIKRAFSLLIKAPIQVFTTILISIVLIGISFGSVFLLGLLSFTIVSTISALILINLQAQTYKIAKNRLES